MQNRLFWFLSSLTLCRLLRFFSECLLVPAVRDRLIANLICEQSQNELVNAFSFLRLSTCASVEARAVLHIYRICSLQVFAFVGRDFSVRWIVLSVPGCDCLVSSLNIKHTEGRFLRLLSPFDADMLRSHIFQFTRFLSPGFVLALGEQKRPRSCCFSMF